MTTPLEKAEEVVKIERAKVRLAELENAFETVKQEVSNCSTVEDLVKVMSRYVARFNNARATVNRSQE